MKSAYCFLLSFVISAQSATVLPQFPGFHGTRMSNTGVVTSPGYPRAYPANYHNFMNIYVPKDSNVTLRFTYFDVQDCPNCNCDHLDIDDGKLCGSGLPNGNGIIHFYDYTYSYIQIRFDSDSSEQHTGFFMEYTVDDPAENKVDTTTQDPPSTFVYSTTQPPPSTYNPKEYTTVTQTYGVITSPGYPLHYQANQTKEVSVRLPLRSTVEIQFKHFDLQDCYNCRCDGLSISFFDDFCGSRLPNGDGHLVVTYTNQEYINFRFSSDATVEGSGFYLTYNIYPSAGTTVPPPTCPPTSCDHCAMGSTVLFRPDSLGCMMCDCSPTTAKYNHYTGTTPRPSYSSLLLRILFNLETEAKAMELQAQSVKDVANMAINMLQHGNGGQ